MAVSVPLFPIGQAAAAAGRRGAVTPSASGLEALTAHLLPAGEDVTEAAPAPLLPTDSAAAAAVNAAPVPDGIRNSPG